ncbi:MAG: cupin domain-containing protein [Actinomycetota bacterium]
MGESYFERAGGESPDHGRFVSLEDEVRPLAIAPGLAVRPVFGRNMTLSFVWLDPHSAAPVHEHAEEQMGTIIDGSLEFELCGEKRLLRRGDVYVVPPFVSHGAVTGDEPCLCLDAFSPPREALRRAAQPARPPG